MMNTQDVRANKDAFLKALACGVKNFDASFRGSNDASKAYQDSISKGQKPLAVVINCADSRQPASLVLGMDPGELFAASSIAAMVHPYGDDKSLHIWATLEYAINHLGVPYVVQLGHTKCGGCEGLVKTVRKVMDEGDKALAGTSPDDHVLAWLKPCIEIGRRVQQQNPKASHEELCSLTEIEVLKASAANIHAFLKQRHDAGMLKAMPTVIALVYDLKSGGLSEVDQSTGEIRALSGKGAAASGCCGGHGGCCGH